MIIYESYNHIYKFSADLMGKTCTHSQQPSIFKNHKTHQWPQNHVICKLGCLAVLVYVQALTYIGIHGWFFYRISPWHWDVRGVNGTCHCCGLVLPPTAMRLSSRCLGEAGHLWRRSLWEFDMLMSMVIPGS